MKKLIGIVLAAVMFLSGCGLFPAEEELPKAPVVQTMDESYFTTAEVKKGTVRDFVSERCTYQYESTQNLSFGFGGEAVKETYVAVGQKVSAGDVLAELANDDMEDRIEALREQIAELEEQEEYCNELLTIEKERKELASRYGKKYDDTKLKQLQNDYDDVSGRKYVADLQLGEMETELSGRRLIAGIDGIVEYIKQIPPWMNGRINANERYITIRSEKAGFVISTGNDSIYEFGKVFTITTDQGDYDCEVVQINRPTAGKGGMTTVVLEPLRPDGNLEIGMTGQLICETERADNVLYIPSYALHTIDDKPAVYVIDAQGLLSIRYLEIGISIKTKSNADDNRTEVRSGLSLGEKVIVQ
ncbi:MAG: efflux RND transporter periplasmic adaptor subunit [Lachnospiraceae bacterium]|nr:efflux RND transporter periplasmic adaptor subunit [Lachnospiraceae bacterium]